MSNNSIIEHRANYYFVEFREEFLIVCMNSTYKKPVKEGKKSAASPHCKSLILAILENWTNGKRGRKEDLSIYMTYKQWSDSMYGMFGRNAIIDSLDELVGDGLLTRENHKTPDNKDTYKYRLQYHELNNRLKQLPDRSIHDTRPKSDASENKRDASENKPVTRPKKDVSPSEIGRSIDTAQNHDPNICKESTPPDVPSESTSPNASPACMPSSSLLESLSPNGRRLWGWWSGRSEIEPKLTEIAKEHVEVLGPHIESKEQMESLIAFSLKKLQKRKDKTDGIVKLGNLRNDHPEWKQTQTKTSQGKAVKPLDTMSKDELIAHALSFPTRMDHHTQEYKDLQNCLNRLNPDEKANVVRQRMERQNQPVKVLWTRQPNHDRFALDVSAWYLFEWMTLDEARQYEYDLYQGLPGDLQTRINIQLEREKRGELPRPALVS